MLSIFGIVAIVVFTIQVYKTASGTGKSAPLWTILTVVTGVGVQFILPIFIGLIFGIYLLASGSNLEGVDRDYNILFSIIGIFGMVLSIVGMWLIWKHVSKVSYEDPLGATPPPPPPTFGQNVQ